eukprot:311737-Pyramimonas_sp.AAC.1
MTFASERTSERCKVARGPDLQTYLDCPKPRQELEPRGRDGISDPLEGPGTGSSPRAGPGS